MGWAGRGETKGEGVMLSRADPISCREWDVLAILKVRGDWVGRGGGAESRASGNCEDGQVGGGFESLEVACWAKTG